MSTLDRRDFLRLVGGGITVAFTVGDPLALAQRGRDYPEDLNAYLRIGENGRVSCLSGKIEMGQGIITSLAQMVAEELDVSLASVDMVMADTDLCPWDAGTFGSRSTKYFGPPLRKAAAEARAVLLQLASERLGTTPDRLTIENGKVMVSGSPQKVVTYAELVKGKKVLRRLGEDVSIKPVSKHRISGKPTPRTDSRQKVTGEAKFAGDIRPPEMHYAKILRPPAHDAKVVSIDTSGAERIEGVRVIKDGDLVAVLHSLPDVAETALEKVKAQFDVPESPLDNRTIFDHLVKVAPAGEVVTEQGQLEEGKRLAEKNFEHDYLNQYVAHAPIEPHTAAVQIEGGKATVWASTQTPFRAKEAVAETLGLPADNVRVLPPFVGGGFGGKTNTQQIVEAARLAKAAGCPVQVAWTRKEEFFYDTFRPAAVIKIRSGLDARNRIVYWDYDNYYAGTRSSQPFYDIPHHRVLTRGGRRDGAHPFGTGAWRGPGSNTNVFAIESQIDAMAEAAGMDPLTFRLHNLANDRMKRVLNAAAEKFGRNLTKAPSGRGYGLACTDYLGTHVATMAEVEVDKKTGKVRVKRVVCAQDMGEVINPQGAQLQLEGCITMGLGSALTEEIRFKGGNVLDENFDTYELPRFSWLPEIETVLVDNPDMAPQGCGEPAITTMGAVLANAVYDAIGARMFELPMTPERVKKAL
jgi:isoquinoline 1-oxidoreductase